MNIRMFFKAVVSTAAGVSLLAGCGDEGVAPRTASISGPLGDYFEVVDRTYKIIDGKINIEFERIESGLPEPWEEGVEIGYGEGTVTPEFSAEFLDKDGDVICKDATDIVWEKKELSATVALGIGESTSIPFSVEGKKIVAFKVSSTFKANGLSQKTQTEVLPEESPEVVNLCGKISSYPIHMTLRIAAGEIKGRYYYDSQRKKGNTASIKVYGARQGSVTNLNEFSEGDATGQFCGALTADSFSGTFTRLSDGKEMPFKLNVSQGEDGYFMESELLFSTPDNGSVTTASSDASSSTTTIVSSFSQDSFSSSQENNSTGTDEGFSSRNSSSSSTSDWDKVLDEYESYVNQYIKLYKQAMAGDMSAMAEYANLLEKAESLCDKMEDAQDDMSMSQWNRYMKITNKLTTIAF